MVIISLRPNKLSVLVLATLCLILQSQAFFLILLKVMLNVEWSYTENICFFCAGVDIFGSGLDFLLDPHSNRRSFTRPFQSIS